MKVRDISAWESFYWLAREGNFTVAAKRQNIGVSLLSKRINKLEEDLNVRLFTRSTRKVALTKEGEGLLPMVEGLLQDLTSIEDRFEKQTELKGTIRMTCINAYAHRVLPGHMMEFSKLHPGVRFEINATDETIDLIDNQIDIAIRVQEPSGADYVFKKIRENKIVLCASAKYLRSLEKEIKKPADLKHHPILTLKVYENCRFLKTDMVLKELDHNRVIKSESGLYLTELALKGAGVAVRSLWDVEGLIQNGKLVHLLPNHPIESFGNLYAVIPTKRLMTVRVRTFLDYLMERIAQ